MDVKRGFIGIKKTELHISETGMRMPSTKKQEFSSKSQHLQQLYYTGEMGQMQSFMDSNRMWMPMMLFSGIMSVTSFASMMSFMGMAMNPSVSAMDEGQAGESGGAEDSWAVASDSESGGASDVGAEGDMGGGGGGGGGMDAVGMDAGGFESF